MRGLTVPAPLTTRRTVDFCVRVTCSCS